MRKIIAYVLLILLLCALALPAAATSSASMSISTSTSRAYRGDTISFSVRMSAVENCGSAGIRLSYNTSVFEFVSGSVTASGATYSDFSGGTATMLMDGTSTVSGTIFTFVLKVRQDAPMGSYTVSGTGSARSNGSNISTSVSGATVTIACKHDYSDWTRVDENTHSHTCSICGDTPTEAHNWNNYTITKYATCIATGERTYKCSACGETKTEVIPISSYHDIPSFTNINDGYHKGSCTICGQSFSLPHNWNNSVVIKEPTCVAEGETQYTCSSTNCGAVKTVTVAATGQHTYENPCDTQCAVCGNVRDAAHTYENTWVTDKQGHYRSCVYCGEKAQQAEHTPGAAPAANTAQTCTVCRYIIQPALNHVHAPSESWVADETSHWHSCPGCSEQLELTAHDFENPCDTLCEGCGYTRQTGHVFSKEMVSDENAHFLLCESCGLRSEEAAHIPGEPATEFAPQSCTVCGHELAPALGHDFATFWSWDSVNHFHSCDCGEHADAAGHAWSAGVENHGVMTYTCTVCGAQSARLAPADWRLIVLLAVPFLLGGAVGVTITCLIKRRRR